VLTIEADGTVLWNDEQVMHAELARRLDALKNAAGPPRSVIVRTDPQAPPAASEQVIRMLQDRSVTFIIEDHR
jgi:biopolymer transport protein ExbD